MSSFIRRLTILEFLRSTRTEKSTEEILNHLVGSGYLDESQSPAALKRLVQRDMNFLYGKDDGFDEEDSEPTNEFGLLAVRGVGKSWLWKLDPYASLQFDYEKMPQYMAIAFAMAKKHLSNLLPRNTLSELERFFAQAEHRLEQSEQSLSPQLYSRLKESVEFYQRGQRLQPAEFDVEHLDTIYRGILHNRQLHFRYRGKDYQVHPFGVAILLPKLYLVGKKHEDVDQPDEYRHFLIHKIESIYIGNQTARIPPDFSLRAYLEAGHMDVYIEPEDTREYSLKLCIKPFQRKSNLIDDLIENPISGSQEIIRADDDTYYLTANVRRTIQLRNWLISLGPESVVEQPEMIRKDLRDYLRVTLKAYE
ncbi:WYL domain-containing protein [Hahella sp. CCB-MM4]|uniref:helix-turn-helix transcriptional regulator n=1 Tax=Hahella sp. (strain CCB-MM4) TaxID=1926491 RepID=UPI000B9B006E|nr:WYL domain-containing protein [Hahella sp. CCB-MM4]OZG72277.1 WYL domain-containing protein [Hahella sp. CCB-MM4]